MKRWETKYNTVKFDILGDLSQAVALVHYFYSSIFLFLPQFLCSAASCSEVLDYFFLCHFLASYSQQQTEINCCSQLHTRSCFPSHVSSPRFQYFIKQKTDTWTCKSLAVGPGTLHFSNYSPPLLCNTQSQEAASAIKQTCLRKGAAHLSSTAIREEYFKGINKFIMRWLK